MKAARDRAGLTLEDMAAALVEAGVVTSRASLSRYENGVGVPSEELLMALASESQRRAERRVANDPRRHRPDAEVLQEELLGLLAQVETTGQTPDHAGRAESASVASEPPECPDGITSCDKDSVLSQSAPIDVRRPGNERSTGVAAERGSPLRTAWRWYGAFAAALALVAVFGFIYRPFGKSDRDFSGASPSGDRSAAAPPENRPTPSPTQAGMYICAYVLKIPAPVYTEPDTSSKAIKYKAVNTGVEVLDQSHPPGWTVVNTPMDPPGQHWMQTAVLSGPFRSTTPCRQRR